MTLNKCNHKKYVELIGTRDGWFCHYCGVPLIEGSIMQCIRFWSELERRPKPVIPVNAQVATIDHKIARANGGTNELDNLVLACHQCNSKKGARYSYEQFLERAQ